MKKSKRNTINHNWKKHKSKIWLFVFFNVTLQRNTADMAQLVEQRIRNA